MKYKISTTNLLLINQYDILCKLCPENGFYVAYKEALEQGYTQFYPEGADITSGLVMENEHKLICEILNMYREIQVSTKDVKSISKSYTAFKGFDGNDEAEGVYVHYIDFMVNRLGKYSQVRIEDANSHTKMMDTYIEQLSRWRKGTQNAKWETNKMTEDQVRYVLEGIEYI